MTLPGKLWALWLSHMLTKGRSRLYVALMLSQRIIECLRLAAEDFSTRAGTVYIGPLKRQGTMRKPMLSEVKATLSKLKKQGVKRKRLEEKGSRGKATWRDNWVWLRNAVPADRMDCSTEGRNKDTVCKAVER